MADQRKLVTTQNDPDIQRSLYPSARSKHKNKDKLQVFFLIPSTFFSIFLIFQIFIPFQLGSSIQTDGLISTLQSSIWFRIILIHTAIVKFLLILVFYCLSLIEIKVKLKSLGSFIIFILQLTVICDLYHKLNDFLIQSIYWPLFLLDTGSYFIFLGIYAKMRS